MLFYLTIIATFLCFAALAGGIAMALRGNVNTEVEGRLDVLTGVASGPGEKGNEASLLTHPLDEMPGAFEEFLSRFGNFRRFLDQAEINIAPPKFFAIMGALAAVGAAIPLVLGAHPLFAPLAGLALGVLPLGWAWWKRSQRLASFGKQLPDALELVARALRAGHSLAAGFHLVANEMADPIAKEFNRVYEEQNLGIAMEDALEEMTERVPNLDLRFFATAVVLQRQTGGDLAEILDKIGRLIRERFKIYGQIQALTGEGRLSGIVLLGLPPFLFVAMLRLNYDYVMMLFEDPLGKQMLAGGIVLQAVGAIVIRKIINIKV